MSLQKCKKCDLTKHISDYASSGSCPVDGGNHEFEFYNNSPFLKVSPLSPETLEKMRLVEVYRRALERNAKPHTGEHIYNHDCDACHRREIAEEALLTSKPEPVAQE